MNSSTSPGPMGPTSARGIRWWPALLVVLLATWRLAVVWLGEAGQRQDRVVPTLAIVGTAAVALVLWLLLLSRLPGRSRVRLGLGLLVLSGLSIGLFEMRGVSGDLIPDIRFRWGGAAPQSEAQQQAAVVERTATDYPQFLGPQRNAVVPNVRLATDWQAQPPKELWRQTVGDAWSSFAVVGSALLTQEQRGDQEAVVRYDLETGQLVWVFHYPGAFESVIGGNGPRATPTIEGDRVYSLGSTGVLSSLDLQTGELRWQKDLAQEHGATRPEWGYAGSPLLLDGLVVVAPGGPDGHSVVAYDADSGELVWQAGDDPAAYASPTVMELAGQRQIVVRHLGAVTGHDPSRGTLLWRIAWPGQQPNVAQPLLLGDDRLLISSGYGIGSQLVHFSPSPTGDALIPEVLWESRRMKAKFTNMVPYAGAVFGLDDGVLVSLDPETGERHWKKGRYGHGQLLLVDGTLLILSEAGDVVLVAADPAEHREIARFKALGEKSWNTPALAGRHLLLRNASQAVCFELPLLAG